MMWGLEIKVKISFILSCSRANGKELLLLGKYSLTFRKRPPKIQRLSGRTWRFHCTSVRHSGVKTYHFNFPKENHYCTPGKQFKKLSTF